MIAAYRFMSMLSAAIIAILCLIIQSLDVFLPREVELALNWLTLVGFVYVAILLVYELISGD